ncbi:MAG: peptidylprolyl isomerase [bacterium]
MGEAKTGDTVQVHYKGSLDDGTMFDRSPEQEPLEICLGQGSIIPAIENAIVGMTEGETKSISLQPEEAFGPYQDDQIFVIDRSQVPPNIDPEVGMILQLTSREGSSGNVTITDVTQETITLDGNHPLAGKTVLFEVRLETILC